MTTYDAVIVGAGLAGLVAAGELVQAGRRVALVDQENASNLGGQAYWSFGGLFLVDSPEQRRLGVRDSFDLAWSDWQGSAGWDRLDGVTWRRTHGRNAGGGPMSRSPPERSATGCVVMAFA